MNIRAPLSETEVRSLEVGDEVRVDGIVLVGRDEVHRRALEYHEQGRMLPVDLEGGVLFHCGPIVRRSGEGWELIAAGPTTSSRMDSLEPKFIETFGVRAIIGKGGMSQPTVDAMERFGCVYLAFTGGAAVLGAQGIKKVRGVEWLDLGMPEALWILEAKGLGPLTVAIDARGRSLYKEVDQRVDQNLVRVRRELSLD